MDITGKLRAATKSEVDKIWEILSAAIQRRRLEGSNQWQDGYPNKEVVEHDIHNGHGYVWVVDEQVIGYCALLINDEPQYAEIEGQWLTEDDFVVVHRVAIASEYLGQGWAQKIFKAIEEFALSHQIYSVKVDTNYDNPAMLRIFEKLDYQYCGIVHFRNSPRRAFEKVLFQ